MTLDDDAIRGIMQDFNQHNADRTTLTGVLGKGATSVIYDGTRQVMPGVEQPVAVKVYLKEDETDSNNARQWLREKKDLAFQEARRIALINSGYMVKLYAGGSIQGRDYLIIEKVTTPEGMPNLEAVIEDERATLRIVDAEMGITHTAAYFPSIYSGPLRSPDYVVRLAIDLLEAFQQLHSEGYVHRDVKPSNIILQRKCTHFKVVDAQTLLSTDQPSLNASHGNRAYASPILIRNERREMKVLPGTSERVTDSVDVYSLKLILMRMVNPRITPDIFPTDDEKCDPPLFTQALDRLARMLPDPWWEWLRPEYGTDVSIRHLLSHMRAALPDLTYVQSEFAQHNVGLIHVNPERAREDVGVAVPLDSPYVEVKTGGLVNYAYRRFFDDGTFRLQVGIEDGLVLTRFCVSPDARESTFPRVPKQITPFLRCIGGTSQQLPFSAIDSISLRLAVLAPYDGAGYLTLELMGQGNQGLWCPVQVDITKHFGLFEMDLTDILWRECTIPLSEMNAITDVGYLPSKLQPPSSMQVLLDDIVIGIENDPYLRFTEFQSKTELPPARGHIDTSKWRDQWIRYRCATLLKDSEWLPRRMHVPGLEVYDGELRIASIRINKKG